MATADLHFHSSYSDGKHSVNWLVCQLSNAKTEHALGLAILTDHDGIGGFAEFSEAVRDWWTPICASELSCTYSDLDRGKDQELHLLMYGLDPSDVEIQEQFERFKKARIDRFFKMGEKLKAAGYVIDTEGVAAKHPGVLGRPHIADALVEAGIARSRQEAFEKFLKEEGQFYVKKWRFPLEDAVAYARKKGCKTSIAHPGQYNFREIQLKFFRHLGVDAIEAYHPRHIPSERTYYIDAAKRLGFWVTGGSDFHAVDADCINDRPSLGRSVFPLELAQKFLGNFL